MRKKHKIGLVEQEFVHKQGMKERLIEAYQITVKEVGAPKKEGKNEFKKQSTNTEKTSSNLRKSVFIETS